jgi:D-amino-acid dehydrogenase
MRTVVLGAGISGVTTAYYLARLGHEVTVIDRRQQPADETSFANGGVIGGTQVMPWAAPGLPWKLIGWLGKEEAPLLLRLSQLPSMWSWGLRLLASCSASRFRATLAANTALTLLSLEEFKAVRAATRLDYDLGTRGVLKLMASERELADTLAEYRPLGALGLPFASKTPAECVEIEPALAASAPFAGGLHFPREEVGDCRKFTHGLAEECRRLGVRFLLGTPIEGLAVAGGRVGAAVTAKGPVTGEAFVAALASHTPILLLKAGVRVPICPVKGVSVTVPVEGWNNPISGAIIDQSRMFGLIRIGDRVRAAGSAEITGYDDVPSPVRCRALTDNVQRLLPGFAQCLARAKPTYWAGLRGVSPDGRPILGRTPIANLFLNAGHGPQGWSTSCGAARAVAEVVAGRSPPIDLAPFALARFA